MDVQQMIDSYISWLKNEITFEKYGEYYEITTPFLDNANDYIQFYIKQEDDQIHFTDDGITLANLSMCGINMKGQRQKYLEQILRQNGIQNNKGELTMSAPISEYAQKKHIFIQALLRIDDMFALSKTRVASLFVDDIVKFFDQNDIIYSKDVQFTGKTGFLHTYDFLIPHSKTKPERCCQAINTPSKTNMQNVLFSWIDTRATRKEESQLIVLLNDQSPISKGVAEGFSNYDVHMIEWSKRNAPEKISLLQYA